MQTILGSGGVIANGLARELAANTGEIRLVSRNPKKINDNDILIRADLKDPDAVMKAVIGSEVVYLTAGLKYDIKIWKSDWPVIIKNVLEACKRAGAKLVFFDNVYALGAVSGPMKENSPMNPVSQKGEVRKELSELILDAVSKGDVQAIIARAADFYGPNSPLSVINILLLEKYAKGKSGRVLISDKFKHSYTFTPDASKALSILGSTPSAFNRIWHLPTDSNSLTGKEFAELAAEIFRVKAKYGTVSKMMLKLLGIFSHDLKEIVEMTYQNDRDYIFDSSDFEKTFNFKPTSYKDGLIETAGSFKN
jgi:nucleoside-diphosphate-sugar epimerase